MNEDLISIVVPIYNVEKYLERCIESILLQTYTNIEIILVDDGSPDNCGKICDDYKIKDKRIKVIHKNNGGLSTARNAGIDIARGTYICFIDSDDWISNKFVEYLHKIIKQYCADIAVAQTLDVSNEKNISIPNIEEKIGIYSNQNIIENLYNKEIGFPPSVQNKMYKTEIFKKVRFKNGIINEDEEILIKLLLESSKIVVSNKIMYYYFLSENSIMRKKFNVKRLDILNALEERMDILNKTKYKDTLKQTELRYCLELANIYIQIVNSDIKEKKLYLKKIVEKNRIIKKKLIDNKYYTTKNRFKIFLYYKMPKTVYIYKKYKNNQQRGI